MLNYNDDEVRIGDVAQRRMSKLHDRFNKCQLRQNQPANSMPAKSETYLCGIETSCCKELDQTKRWGTCKDLKQGFACQRPCTAVWATLNLRLEAYNCAIAALNVVILKIVGIQTSGTTEYMCQLYFSKQLRRSRPFAVTRWTAGQLFIFALLLLSCLSVCVQCSETNDLLRLKHPSKETVWYEGRHGLIEWATTGRMTMAQQDWKIELVRATQVDSRVVSLIAEKMPLTGSMRFRVPMGSVGAFEQRYKLRFSSSQGILQVPSSGFLIRPQILLVLEPAAPDPWMVEENIERTYSVSQRIWLSWRSEPDNVGCSVTAELQSPYSGVQRLQILPSSGCTGRSRVSLPSDVLPGKGYRIVFKTSDGRRTQSPLFTLVGQSIEFRSPSLFDKPHAVGDALQVEWVAHGKHVHRTINLELSRRGSRNVRLMSVDADREKAVINLPTGRSDGLASGYYRIQARTGKQNALLGESCEIYISNFEVFLLSPVLADIQEPTGAIDALATYVDVLPIRWFFRNPGKAVSSVDIVLRAVQNPAVVHTVATDVSLAKRRHQYVSLDWKFPFDELNQTGLLEVPVRLDVFPHMSGTSTAFEFKSTNKSSSSSFATSQKLNKLVSRSISEGRAVSGPFVLGTSAAPASPTSKRGEEFQHDALIFSPDGLGQQWIQGSLVKVPGAVRLNPRTRGASRQLKIVIPDTDHIIKSTRSLTAGVGESFAVPMNVMSNRMVFIKAVDSRRPDRTLGAVGPFWLTPSSAQLLTPYSGEVHRPGDLIPFTWYAPEKSLIGTAGGSKYVPTLSIHGPRGFNFIFKDISALEGRILQTHWQAPCTLSYGTYYIFEDRAYDKDIGKEKSEFDTAPIGSFRMISSEAGISAPLHRDIWRPGSPARIAWLVSEGINPCVWGSERKVNIVLQIRRKNVTLASEVPNNGEAFVHISPDLPDDSTAQLFIVPQDISAPSYMTLASEPFHVRRVPRETFIPSDDLRSHKRFSSTSKTVAASEHSRIETLVVDSASALAQRIATSLGLLTFLFGVAAIAAHFRHEVSYILRGGGGRATVTASSQPATLAQGPKQVDGHSRGSFFSQHQHQQNSKHILLSERERRDECRLNAVRALNVAMPGDASSARSKSMQNLGQLLGDASSARRRRPIP